MRKITSIGNDTGTLFNKFFVSVGSEERISSEVKIYRVPPEIALEMVEKATRKNNVMIDLNQQINRYKKYLNK